MVAKKIGNLSGQGNALGNLGIVYFSQGDYQQAIKYNQQRLEIAQKIGDRPGQMKAMGNLGNAYHQLEKEDKAIEYLEIL